MLSKPILLKYLNRYITFWGFITKNIFDNIFYIFNRNWLAFDFDNTWMLLTCFNILDGSNIFSNMLVRKMRFKFIPKSFRILCFQIIKIMKFCFSIKFNYQIQLSLILCNIFLLFCSTCFPFKCWAFHNGFTKMFATCWL